MLLALCGSPHGTVSETGLGLSCVCDAADVRGQNHPDIVRPLREVPECPPVPQISVSLSPLVVRLQCHPTLQKVSFQLPAVAKLL